MNDNQLSEENGNGFLAFISYSQKDVALAKRLQHALQTYRVPSPVQAEGLKKDRRIGRIFRDQENLGADASLSKALDILVDSSNALVVLCTPDSAQSPWVNREIIRFKRREEPKVFAVIAKGVPHAKQQEKECFAPALSMQYDVNGNPVGQPDEPVAPDLQKEPFAKVVARLVSGLLDIPFDELWQHERRRRRTRLLFSSAASVFLVFIFSLVSLETLRAFDAAKQISLSEQLSRQAWRVGADTGAFDRAFRAALSATPPPGSPIAQRIAFETCDLGQPISTATCALALSGQALPQFHLFDEMPDTQRGNFRDDIEGASGIARRALNLSSYVRSIRFSADSKQVALLHTDGRLLVYDFSTTKVVFNQPVVTRSNGPVALSPSGDVALIANADSPLMSINLQSKEKKIIPLPIELVHDLYIDEKQLLVVGTSYQSGYTKLYRLAPGEETTSIDLPEYTPYFSRGFISDGLGFVSFSSELQHPLQVVDTTNGSANSVEIERLDTGVGQVKSIAVDSSGQWVVIGGNGSDGSTNPARLLSLNDQSIEHDLIGHSGEIPTVAINIKRGLIATGGTDLTVRLWNLSTGKEIIRVSGHASTIMEVEFSPDGNKLVTTATDGLVIATDLSALDNKDNSGPVVCDKSERNFQWPSTILETDERRDNAAFIGRPWELCNWKGTASIRGYWQGLRAMLARWVSGELFDERSSSIIINARE